MEVLCFSTRFFFFFWRWWEAREGQNEYPSWFPVNNKGQGSKRSGQQWNTRLRIRTWWDRDSRWKEKRTSGLENRAVERGEQGWDKAQLPGDWKKEVSAGKHPSCAEWGRPWLSSELMRSRPFSWYEKDKLWNYQNEDLLAAFGEYITIYVDEAERQGLPLVEFTGNNILLRSKN